MPTGSAMELLHSSPVMHAPMLTPLAAADRMHVIDGYPCSSVQADFRVQETRATLMTAGNQGAVLQCRDEAQVFQA